MADKRISQLVDRGTVANNDVVPIVVSGATTTNKATISSIQTFMQGNLDLGVTSVGITLGSSGTDVSVSGSPITSSGNITINLPTASATNRGLLSAADWVTFNSKQDAGSFVTLDTTQTITAQKTFTTSGSSDTMIISHGSGSGFALDVLKAGNGEAIRVTKTSGSGNAMTISGGNFEAGTIVKTGGTSSQFLKADGSVDSTAYTTNTGTVTSVSGTGTVSGLSLSGTVTTSGNLTLGGTLSLTSANVTDALGFTPYNATNPAGYTTNVGTVTSVAALTLGTSGTDLSSTVANGTTTPVITLNVPTASATNRGALSSADWTTFNNKQNALTNPITGTGATGQVAYWTGTNSQAGSNNLFWDNTNIKLGIGTNTPESTGLTIAGGGIIVSLDTTAARKVLELYASSTGAKVSSTYVGASSYGSLELLTSNEARLTITAAGAATFSSTLACSGTFIQLNQTEFIASTGASNRAYAISLGNTAAGDFVIMQGSTATGGTYTPRLTINPSGNVGIGTASPAKKLDVYESSTATVEQYIRNTTINGLLKIDGVSNFQVGTETNHPLFLITNNTTRLTIASTGEATFSSTVATTGIKFPATQVASADANTLDDYEEGTWTPVLSSNGGTPTGTTYTDRNATYTKVGRSVTVTGGFLLSNKGTGGSGETRISGLPFTQRSTGGYGEGTASVKAGSLTTAALASRVDLFTASGASYLRLRTDQNDAELDFTEITNTTYIKFTCTYFV